LANTEKITLGLAAIALLGGDCRDTHVYGEQHRAAFEYDATTCGGSSVGCNPRSNSLASGGARAHVIVSGGSSGCGGTASLSFVTARSTAPNVATFTGTGQVVDVVTGQPGTTELELYDGPGALIDRIAVTVADVATLSFTPAAASPLLLVGAPEEVTVEPLDAMGRTILGGVLTVTGEGAVMIDSAASGADVRFHTAAGPGALVATLGPTTARLELEGVTPEAVSQLVVLSSQSTPRTTGAVASVTVALQALTAADPRPVVGARCAWTPSDPLVTVESAGTSSFSDPRMSNVLVIGKLGAYKATCTVGGATITIDLTTTQQP
jgi:hypothetical protein